MWIKWDRILINTDNVVTFRMPVGRLNGQQVWKLEVDLTDGRTLETNNFTTNVDAAIEKLREVLSNEDVVIRDDLTDLVGR